MRGLLLGGWLLSLAACSSAGDDGDPSDETDDTPHTDGGTDAPADTDGATERLVDVTVATDGPIACANPEARVDGPWSEVKRGGPIPTSPPHLGLMGGGAAIADFNGDGHYDVFSPGLDNHRLSMWTDHHTYENRFDTAMAGIDLTYATGASAVDYDGDGDMDLFVTRWDMTDRLLENDGTGTFTDVTRRSQIRGIARSMTSSWGDMDLDGDLDLFVGTYGPHPEDQFAEEDFTVGEPSAIWMNVGDGRFVERSQALPPDIQRAYVFMSSWVDLNADARPELLLINDFGWARPSRIFWNRPEGLVEDDGTANFDIYFAGMGLGIADLNGDEVPDFLQSSWRELSLLMSDGGDMVWYDYARATALWPDYHTLGADNEPPEEPSANQVFGWGAELADLDNDGDSEAVVLFGEWDQWVDPVGHRDGLWVQADDGTFVDEAAAWGFDDAEVGRGLLTVDLDDDGYLDVYKRTLDTRSPLYFSQCGTNHWVKVRLRAPGTGNTHGIGARVRVEAGGKVWNRWITAGGTSMFSGGPPEAHIGLGDIVAIDRIEVFWSGGGVSVLEDVGADQTFTLTR